MLCYCNSRLPRKAAILASLVLLSRFALAAPSMNWMAIPSSDLVRQKSDREPEAAAEALLWRYEVDNRDFPDETRVKEYVRYKIYRPENMPDLTRFAALSDSGSHRVKSSVYARLTLPNGTVRDFGQDAVLERSLERHAGAPSLMDRLFHSKQGEKTEAFLPISGIEAGAIVDVQYSVSLRDEEDVRAVVLQLDDIPVRELVYTEDLASDNEYDPELFILNTAGRDVASQKDKHGHRVTITAHGLPSISDEPSAPSRTNSYLTVVSTCRELETTRASRSGREFNVRVDPQKDGPWATVAVPVALIEVDCTQATPRVEKIAREVTAGTTAPLEKARRIHSYAQELHQGFLRLPGKSKEKQTLENRVRSLDDILDYEKSARTYEIDDEEFLWLEIALDRLAGLDAHAILLPDASVCRFDRQLVTRAFLPDLAAAIKIDGTWHFAAPHLADPFPFDLLPAENLGQIALLAQQGPETFIDVPFPAATSSLETSVATLELLDSGDLVGEGSRTYTGLQAAGARSQLRGHSRSKRISIVRDWLAEDIPEAEITVGELKGVEEIERPLEVSFQIKIRHYAQTGLNRMALRPLIFDAQSTSPFSATTRRQPIVYDYPYGESSNIVIRLPAGSRPQSELGTSRRVARGALEEEIRFRFDPARRELRAERSLLVHTTRFPASSYPEFKRLRDAIVLADRQEAIFACEKPASPVTGVVDASGSNIRKEASTPGPDGADKKFGGRGKTDEGALPMLHVDAHVPEWSKPAFSEEVGGWSHNTARVVLTTDKAVTYLSPDRVRVRVRTVERAMRENGRKGVVATYAYDANSEKIVSAEAWLIAADGHVAKRYLLRDFKDVVADNDPQFWDAGRMIILKPGNDMESGGALISEIVVESQAGIFEYNHSFFPRTATARAFFEITPCAGHKLTWYSTSERVGPPGAGAAPGALRWERQHLYSSTSDKPTHFIPNPLSVSVRCIPVTGTEHPTWAELAGTVSGIMEPKIAVTPEIKAKAAALTVGKNSRWDRIGALTEFVQRDINYLSITLDTDYIAGFRPHAAAEVLDHRYGDCKDKATLLTALLRAMGERCYPVLVTAEDRSAISANWPTIQFNHAIVAIAADADVPAAWPVVDAGALGRVVIFDPTDRTVPLGALSFVDQGGKGLLIAESGTLIDLPAEPADRIGVDRQMSGALDTSGALRLSVTEIYHGTDASDLFARRKYARTEEFTQYLQERLRDALPNLTTVQWHDDWNPSTCQMKLAFDFAVEQFAQKAGAHSLTAHLNLFTKDPALAAWRTKDEGVVQLNADRIHEETRLTLPAGFVVGRKPDDWKGSEAGAIGRLEFTVEGRELVCRCDAQRRGGLYTKGNYEALRRFYEKLRDATRSEIVLEQTE